MSKKITKTRVSPKQQLLNFKVAAFEFINKLRYPKSQFAFSVATYNTTPAGKKPNAISAPELAAIVGTAAKLGKNVQLSLSGQDDSTVIDVHFVDSPSQPTPPELV